MLQENQTPPVADPGAKCVAKAFLLQAMIRHTANPGEAAFVSPASLVHVEGSLLFQGPGWPVFRSLLEPMRLMNGSKYLMFGNLGNL